MIIPRKPSFFTVMALGLIFTSGAARANNITLQGLFTHDDDVQLFDVTVATAGSVDIRSYGYAGGTTSTGAVIPRGGFDTILTLFNGAGTFLLDNDEGSGVATDPATGEAFDARITTNLMPGSYIAVLTQYDNFSLGNLTDGFAEAGHPNFTADPTFTSAGSCPGNLFRDISGTAGRCRDGDWAVDFLNVAGVTPRSSVPEPGTVTLFSVGLLGLALFVRKRARPASPRLRCRCGLPQAG